MTYEEMRSPKREFQPIALDPSYFGNISRETAEKFLKERGTCEGTYLVRKGVDGFRLSALCLDDHGVCKVLHYEINENPDKTCCIGKEGKRFSTVVDLIDYYKGKHTSMEQPLTESCPIDDIEPADSFEIDKHAIKLKSQLSIGAFSDIWIAKLQTSELDVIVKSLCYDDERHRSYLLSEIQILQKLQHRNVLKLLGQTKCHPISLIFDYHSLGNLSEFLSKNGVYIHGARKLQLGGQIADGLHYLSGMNIVHRNIRASNILMTDDQMCLLAGFGYAAFLNEDGNYVKKEDDKPFDINAIRWMAPEASLNGIFSTASDVWSFASTMHEIFSNGEVPYSDIFAPDLLEKIQADCKPPRLVEFSYSFYRLLLNCWDIQADKRPLFDEIQILLKELQFPTIEEQKTEQKTRFVKQSKTEEDTRYERPMVMDIFDTETLKGSATLPPKHFQSDVKSTKQQKSKQKKGIFSRHVK